jgi:hypothetical protein
VEQFHKARKVLVPDRMSTNICKIHIVVKLLELGE